MKTFSILKRAIILTLCLCLLVCVASCKKAEETADFGPEMNDITVGKGESSFDTENDDIGNTEPSDEGKDPATQDPADDSAKPDTDSKPDTDAKPNEEKPAEDANKDPAKDPASCKHSWKNATCEAPKTCSKCGATEGKAAGHKWKAGNCEAPKTCTVCGATDGDQPIHTYKNGRCACGAREWGYGAWTYVKDEDKTIYVATLDFDKEEFSFFEYHTEDTFEYDDEQDDEEGNNEDAFIPAVKSYTYKGVKYLQYEGESTSVSYTINGETITVRVLGGSFTMSKSGKTKATVTEANGVDASLYIDVGVTFEYGT
ncbi:MAG: hypothetical protein IJ995_02465 [Clostridia bacterium]|nr:hypothetical protein [Clostridia bacterium]